MRKMSIFLYVAWSDLEDANNGEGFWAYTTPSKGRVLVQIPQSSQYEVQSDYDDEVWVKPDIQD